MNQPEINITADRVLKECIDITGQRQSGKTKLLEAMLNMNQNHTYIFDTLGVISADIAKGKVRLFPNQHIFNPHWMAHALPDYKARLAVFLPWCQMVWQRGHCIAVIEEWHLFCNRKYELPAAFSALFNQGGNKDIAVWGTSQAPAQCHNDMLRACYHHFVFHLYMPSDLDWMCKFIDKDLIKGNPKDREQMCVKNMPQYHYLYVNTQTCQSRFYEPITIW